jgi:hypothetical protein
MYIQILCHSIWLSLRDIQSSYKHSKSGKRTLLFTNPTVMWSYKLQNKQGAHVLWQQCFAVPRYRALRNPVQPLCCPSWPMNIKNFVLQFFLYLFHIYYYIHISLSYAVLITLHYLSILIQRNTGKELQYTTKNLVLQHLIIFKNTFCQLYVSSSSNNNNNNNNKCTNFISNTYFLTKKSASPFVAWILPR